MTYNKYGIKQNNVIYPSVFNESQLSEVNGLRMQIASGQGPTMMGGTGRVISEVEVSAGKTVDDVVDGSRVTKGVSNHEQQLINGGLEWNKYLKEKYGQNKVFWETPVDSINDIIEVPSLITNMTPNEVAQVAIKDGWSVGPLKLGHLKGVPYTECGGYAMNKGSYYIQYHPGGGHHGENFYYKVSSPTKGKMPRYGEVKFFCENGKWRYERITQFNQ